jgi:tetratricopeptide (TPR) repeat protein
MKQFVRAWVALLGVVLGGSALGCASSRALNCPGEMPSTWKELDSPHFRLVTNRPIDQARIALADFEEAYDVFTGVVLSGEVVDPVPIRVVLFDQENEYKAFGPRGAGAFFNPSLPLDPEPIPTLVMWGDLVAEARLTFQHELTHHIFRNALGPVPVWLSEGLADYYATVRVEGDEVYIGESNPTYEFYLNPDWKFVDTGAYHRYRIPVGDIPKADELIALDRDAFYERGNKDLDERGDVPIEEMKRRTARYAGSWALVHMLTHHPAYGERWGELLAALVAGKGYPVAMDQAYGQVMDSIPKAFHEYLITHHRTAVKTKYTPKARTCPKDERQVTESGAKILFAQLRPFRGPDEALEHAKRAVKMDPGCAPCLEVLGEMLYKRGMIREAIAFEERALAALPETANGDALAKRIQQYRKELVEAAKARKKEAEP